MHFMLRFICLPKQKEKSPETDRQMDEPSSEVNTVNTNSPFGIRCATNVHACELPPH